MPSETTLEDVMVVIYFPMVRFDSAEEEGNFTLKAKLSTLALEGMTPEQAESFAESRGQEVQGANRPPGSGSTGPGGTGRQP